MMKFAVIFILTAFFVIKIFCLRCQTNDGLTEQEVRQVLKKCMRKMSENSNDKNYEEYENYDQQDDESHYNQHQQQTQQQQQQQQQQYHNPSSNIDYRHRNPQYDGGYNNNYQKNWSKGLNKRKNEDNHQRPSNYYNGYSYNGQQHNTSNNYNTSSDRNNSKGEDDHSCILLCFFQELKMVNQDGFPDKHKVLHVLTKDLNDHELKDFYTDSIQECFHVLELEQRREKCNYAKNLVTCLSERAKSNCNDWNGNGEMF